MVHVTTAAAGSVDANYGNLDTYEALTGDSTLQFARRAAQCADAYGMAVAPAQR